MGSIDEKAINGLSFIANLTKHIRVQSKVPLLEESPTTQLEKFFPSFLWLVRDFALELVDEDGDTISSQEYLERALATQSGINQSVLDRNRIRKMITSFFQVR